MYVCVCVCVQIANIHTQTKQQQALFYAIASIYMSDHYWLQKKKRQVQPTNQTNKQTNKNQSQTNVTYIHRFQYYYTRYIKE